MAHLPEGWEADYDGTRWFYRFATTGLTQYHFPRPGDEYPELVGLGFGALDSALEGKHTSRQQEGHQSSSQGVDGARMSTEPTVNGQNKAAPINESGGMSATGYFNPDDFMYFGIDSVSPLGGDKTNSIVSVTATPPVSKSEPALAELPEESERIRSPVGFIAELANGDTAKCAEELAPIELDATQIAPATLQTNIQQNGPTELPTQKSLAEQNQSTERPVQDTARPAEEYPLVSASFAYPPLKTTTKPDSPTQPELKVLASQQPIKDQIGENEYETWKPTSQGAVNEDSRNTNRKSIASSMSVLQSQNSDLGLIEQKRHSLSGPIDSTVPGILRPPSGPAASSTLSPKVESSPVPAVLQPASAPSKVLPPQDNTRKQSAQNGVQSLPGSGARHESISFNSGPPVINSQVPSFLKPAQDIQNSLTPQDHPQLQTQVDNVRPGAHRVNTMPAQPSSHTPSPPKINGPGFYVFQEIPAAPGPTGPLQGGQDAHQLHQNPNQPHSNMNGPPPIVAPLSPQKPTSPNMTNGVNPNTQNSSISNNTNNPHPGTVQIQGKPVSNSTGSPSQQVNVYQSPQAIHPVSYQGSMFNSASPQKLIRKPLLPQRPESANSNTGMPVTNSANIPIRPNNPTLQQGLPSTGSTRPNSVVHTQSNSAPPQANPGVSYGQHIQAHNQRPSISGSPSHTPQHTTAGHSIPVSGHVQGRPSISNTPILQSYVQGANHRLSIVSQTSGQGVFSGQASTQPATTQAPLSTPQNAMQAPSLHAYPGQRPPNNHPATQAAAQVPNQNAIPATGPASPQNSPSPMTQSMSPLQSQVSSPAPSIASIHRPPSSASSLSTHTAQGVVGQSPSSAFAAQQNHQHAIRPTATPATHIQGNQQANQSPKPPVAGPSKPFPMLPGQVTPLPSQVGSTPITTPAQPATPTQGQTQHLQNHAGQIRPPQQQPVSHPMPQMAVNRPPQQQPIQAHHMPNSGVSMPGQPMAAGIQQGQPRPQVYPLPVQPHSSSPGLYTQQGMGQTSQSPNGQQTVGNPQGVTIQGSVQGQVQMTLSPNTGSPQAQPFFTNQQAGLGQGFQQFAQPYGFQNGTSQNFGQGKPFNSSQALSDAGKKMGDAGKKMGDAGKKMKKWAKKQWQNPAVKQSTVAMGGAIFSESIGMNGMAGAAIANKLYAASQNNQPQRPPGLQHANTAPPQAQNMGGVGGASQYLQAMGQTQLQGLQPMGVQTPGRPPVVQNPAMAGAAMNNPAMQQRPQQQQPQQQPQQRPQQRPQMQPNMTNQQFPQQISRPPVGRPPLAQPQPQQPVAFGQPVYQRPLNQQAFQPAPVQPLYQAYPNQPMYQMAPGQPNFQAQPGPDPYAAIGSMIGGAVNTLTAGGKPNEPSSTSHQQQQNTASSEPQEPQHEHHPAQHQVADPEPHHESQSEQHHGGQPEQHHTEQSEQYHEGQHEQQYTGQSEQHQESHVEQNHTSHSEQHQEANAESHQSSHTEQQYTEHTEQHNTVYSEQDQGGYSEQPPADNSYFTSQPETTIINNNTVINNVDNSVNSVDNSNTAVAQTNTNYTDNSQVSQVMETNNTNNTNYTDNTQMSQTMEQTNNTGAEGTGYIDTGYMDTTNTAMDTTAYADATYTDTTAYMDNTAYTDTAAYTDTSNMNTNAEAFASTDTTTYVDSSSYADNSYADVSYADTTAVDVNVDVNVNMNETVYMDAGDQTSMWMEESVSVDAGAYVDVGTVDYSGGDWGGGEW